MSFADTYLQRYATKRVVQLPKPDPDLYFSVVIPVFSEPNVLESLKSLYSASKPSHNVEILVVINEPEGASSEDHWQNVQSENEIHTFRNGNASENINIHLIKSDPLASKKAGPGFARKLGMDEAIRRFNDLNRPDGVIISFDADTICSPNYLTELDRFYNSSARPAGCTVYFEHPLDHTDISNKSHLNAIIQYELYLRYFKMALDWIQFPYSCYSLGSAFSVRAHRYVDVGGMGMQKAGEDFYFLQKCIPLGDIWELNSATVFPSPRISERVVFGTGPFIKQFITSKQDELEVYSLELLKQFRSVFSSLNVMSNLPATIDDLFKQFDPFLPEIETRIKEFGWFRGIEIAFKESGGLKSFRKRFYHEINLLLIIRILNDISNEILPKQAVQNELTLLLGKMGYHQLSEKPLDLLNSVRRFDRKKGNRKIGDIIF